MSTAALILSAGASLRMGRPKALVPLDARHDFLSALVGAYSSLGIAPWVVVGAHAEEIIAAHPTFRFVANAAWPEGQLSSIRCGLRHALLHHASSVLVHPVDAPTVLPSTLATLIQSGDVLHPTLPTFRGARGHPAWLPHRSIESLLVAHTTSLATWLDAETVIEVPVDDAGVLANVNTPDDARRLLRHR